ncbi:hypothetical protein GA707_18280 [Nostocoides sp. F2B08]|uniref:hypothetical protein n=1 Tax=Nostocoides sp. F2B08 TaxID=2653936 RepID=UPI001262EF5B|nr:hypothetical protein [Tetrasphaera sp. F2B08]KAB7741031.1 hypothetical protein GA707_18280 [Tetrasphaera sp. F2B08]
MATLRVDGAAVAALGEDLREVAEVLTDLDGVGVHAGDLGDVSVARALDELLGNWTAVRVELVSGLTALASAAGEAGAAYLQVEAEVGAMFGGVRG